jgi:hypothetical protein
VAHVGGGAAVLRHGGVEVRAHGRAPGGMARCHTDRSLGRVTIYDPILISEIDVGDRYGRSDMRYGHPRYRYEIWSDDMGDDSIDSVILRIDMGCLVALSLGRSSNHVE